MAMQVILTFDSDSIEAKNVFKANDMALIIEDFRSWLRLELKHGQWTMEQQQALELVWDRFHEIKQEYNYHGD